MPPLATYGKRAGKRRAHADAGARRIDHSPSPVEFLDEQDSADELTLPTTGPGIQKRRRVDSIHSSTKKRRASPVSTEEDEAPDSSAVTITAQRTPSGGPNGLRSATPKNATVDLSTPTRNKKRPEVFAQASQGSPAVSSNVASPTKLSKRMLGRSKTETTMGKAGHTSFSSLFPQRTQSLSVLPSSPSTSQSPSRRPAHTNSPSDNSLTATSTPTTDIPLSTRLPLPIHKPKSAVSRTYAGQSRSYLVPLGAAGEEEEDEFTRESYTSLRERWGVDQSEDDPYYDNDNAQDDQYSLSQSPNTPSKSRKYGKGSRSGTTTPNPSPTKKDGSRAKVQGIRPPPLPPGMMNPLKSITELRNKGESRRFLDEVAYLLDGMDKSQSASLAKASALEMVTKLCDNDFFRKAKAADVFTKVYRLFLDMSIGKGDKVLDAFFVVFVVLVSRDPASLTELALLIPEVPRTASSSNVKGKGKATGQEQVPTLVDILFSILDSASSNELDALHMLAPGSNFSDAELKRAGIGKKDKMTMTTLLSTIKQKSNLFSGRSKITTSALITSILQSLHSPSIIPHYHLHTLLNSLNSALKPLNTWSDQPTWKLKLAFNRDIDYDNVYAHLRLLDLYLLGQWGGGDEQQEPQVQKDGEGLPSNLRVLKDAREKWLVRGLVALGIQGEIALRREQVAEEDDQGEEEVSEYDGAIKCLESVLRVLVSLTHGDEAWARSVVLETPWAFRFLMRVLAKSGDGLDDGVQEADLGKEDLNGTDSGGRLMTRAKALDRLCLALALLTNLVQMVDEAKDLVRETYLDSRCTLRRGQCLDACSCPQVQNTSALEILTRLYLKQSVQEPSSEESEQKLEIDADASFLRGHLAVLFGLCMQGKPANQQALLDLLPGARAQRRMKLHKLADQSRQFVAFFAVVAGESQDVQKESSSRVGTEIVQFLEDLRDSCS